MAPRLSLNILIQNVGNEVASRYFGEATLACKVLAERGCSHKRGLSAHAAGLLACMNWYYMCKINEQITLIAHLQKSITCSLLKFFATNRTLFDRFLKHYVWYPILEVLWDTLVMEGVPALLNFDRADSVRHFFAKVASYNLGFENLFFHIEVEFLHVVLWRR